MTTMVTLTCMAPDCGVQRLYRPSALRLSLYTHGVCTLAWFCLSCKERSEIALPDSVAMSLERQGVTSTIVHTPGEILEWPQVSVPRINEHDVGILERSSMEHLEACLARELYDMGNDNVRSEG